MFLVTTNVMNASIEETLPMPEEVRRRLSGFFLFFTKKYEPHANAFHARLRCH